MQAPIIAQRLMKLNRRSLLHVESWSPRFLVAVAEGRGVGRRRGGVENVNPRCDNNRGQSILGDCRFARLDSCESSRNDHFKDRTQV
jgi:hypothetical protein